MQGPFIFIAIADEIGIVVMKEPTKFLPLLLRIDLRYTFMEKICMQRMSLGFLIVIVASTCLAGCGDWIEGLGVTGGLGLLARGCARVAGGAAMAEGGAALGAAEGTAVGAAEVVAGTEAAIGTGVTEVALGAEAAECASAAGATTGAVVEGTSALAGADAALGASAASGLTKPKVVPVRPPAIEVVEANEFDFLRRDLMNKMNESDWRIIDHAIDATDGSNPYPTPEAQAAIDRINQREAAVTLHESRVLNYQNYRALRRANRN